MASESTNADLLVMPAETELPLLLLQLHKLVDEHNPRIVHIDRDQGTIMALPRSAVVAVEFTELSLSMLLQQEVISVVDVVAPQSDVVAPQSAHEALLAAAAAQRVAVRRTCAPLQDQAALQSSLPGDTLWTNIVARGNLLVVCQRPDSSWTVLGAQL